MRKTDTLIKIATRLIFCAMLAYLAVYLVNRFVDPMQTSMTVTATMTDSAAMSGLVIRKELLIKSDARYIDVTAQDGDKIAAGGTIAVAYSSEEALERASQMTVLQRDIEETKAALSSTGGVQTARSREALIYGALTDISSAVRSGDLTGIDTAESTLSGLLFRAGGTETTEDLLKELEDSYKRLEETSSGDMEDITVAQSGTFSTVIDGFEGVSPDYVRELYPDQLREVIAADRVVESDSIGKLITSFNWYYAAIVSKEDASRLVADKTVQLSFGRYYSDYLTARVEYVGKAQGDEQLVLFSIERGASDMLAVRAVAAEIIYSEYTGLRVPLTGLYRYYAGYIIGDAGDRLTEGSTARLTLGSKTYNVTVSEVGSPQRYGDLPAGVEPGGESDNRPSRRQVVFYWPWEDEPAPDRSSGGGTVDPLDGGSLINITSYYGYDPEADDTDRLCVFTVTGLQAERKKVSLIYAGEEYALVNSTGDDALREGNEVIAKAKALYSGKVFH